MIEGIKWRPTRFKELGYCKLGDLWRLVDVSTEKIIGPMYCTRDELLADLERFATVFGCVKPPDPPSHEERYMGSAIDDYNPF